MTHRQSTYLLITHGDICYKKSKNMKDLIYSIVYKINQSIEDILLFLIKYKTQQQQIER
jgi:hypothetical protein